MIWLEFVVVLAAIVIGARVGGAGLGTVAALGLAVLVFGFGLPPSSPPVAVLAILVSVVTAAACLQSSSGMDLMISLADRALRAKPKWITFVGPAVAYAFTFCAGTGHVAYAVLPVIAEVARKAGIRPERPMSISVIASQQAITASPLSAATAGLLGILGAAHLTINNQPVQLWHILAICIPSTLIGCVAGAIAASFMGKELADDPVYKDRLAKGLVQPPAPLPTLNGPERRRAIGAVTTFLTAAALVVAFGMLPSLRPSFPQTVVPAGTATADVIERTITNLGDPERADEPVTREQIAQRLESLRAKPAEIQTVPVSMTTLIQIIMYSAAGVMMLFFGAEPAKTVRTSVAAAGVVAFISIVGLGWLGNCFFDGNKQAIVSALSGVITAHPWVFALGLFALSIVLFSQASTVAALMPVGIGLGLSAGTLIACFPAVNGYFFLPTYGTIIAAVAFDTTGTTRIGKYVLNHSFMLPGLVCTIVSVAIGWVLVQMIF
ncbi:MAG: anaerobic C4-dicarboxylate transporter [Phycisphaeraceae bacterium]|jgi:anaerobic C4-dicarboxylate transporter DcuA|nr:anaerobic C4-dicarboxylate transporter [Phycisphaeraceae bacterium]